MSETTARDRTRGQLDAEHAETLAETMAELLIAIENVHKDLAAIREAQERCAEAMRLHGGQLDALTAAIERLGGMLVRAAGGSDRLSS
ncbi:MAG: hypothetical protein ACRDUX_15230 [Mycobacterium sp.]